MTTRSVLRISLLAAAAFCASGPVLADVKAGVDAWTQGNYTQAVAEWKGLAERGDADAQFDLGQAYKLGRGVPADLAKAEELFAKAAAQGHLQAADNYGLLLFQRGERARAMPYIKAAADRGDPRSQYLLGVAHFNGDNVDKDWVRAYALVSLAQQAGLPQAKAALAQMNQYIPLAQRQQSVALASELAGAAQAARERQLVAADLATTLPPARAPAAAPAASAMTVAARAGHGESPRTAGADYTLPQPVASATPHPATATPHPQVPPPPSAPHSVAVKARSSVPAPTRAPTPTPARTPAPATASGEWRVQLGAFGVPANAEALWKRVKARPELAGHARLLVSGSKITKLQAGGFASEADAQAACSRLSAAGFACLAVRN